MKKLNMFIYLFSVLWCEDWSSGEEGHHEGIHNVGARQAVSPIANYSDFQPSEISRGGGIKYKQPAILNFHFKLSIVDFQICRNIGVRCKNRA